MTARHAWHSAYIAAALAVGVAACSNDRADETRTPVPPTTVALIAEPADTAGRTTYVLALGGGGGVTVGSFRFAIHYDSANVAFAGASGADTLSVVWNDVGGRVLVAGASATGFRPGAWIALRFAPRRGKTASVPATMQVMELADVYAVDIRDRVTVLGAWKPPQ